MLSEPTLYKFGNLKIEANWNEEVKPGKKFKITVGDKTEIMDRKDLYSLMMLFGDEEQQSNLIPVVHSKIITVKRLLTVRAKKDIKKSELIKFIHEFPMTEETYEKFKITMKLERSNKDIVKCFLGSKK